MRRRLLLPALPRAPLARRTALRSALPGLRYRVCLAAARSIQLPSDDQ